MPTSAADPGAARRSGAGVSPTLMIVVGAVFATVSLVLASGGRGSAPSDRTDGGQRLIIDRQADPGPSAVAVDESPRPRITYHPPVDAPVIDGFHMDNGPYGAGNRGLEYATMGGELVSATADGDVTFTGMVAGRLVVTLAHADGRLSSLTHMQSVDVTVGDVVTAEALIGTAGVGLHFGVRENGRYIDPMTLFHDADAGRRRGVAHLVEP